MTTLFTTLKNNAIKTAAVALVAGAALLATPQRANAQVGIGFHVGHARVGVGYAPVYPYAAPVYAPPVYGYGYAAPVYGYYGHGYYGHPYYGRGYYGRRYR